MDGMIYEIRWDGWYMRLGSFITISKEFIDEIVVIFNSLPVDTPT